jgi:hypothetical protein
MDSPFLTLISGLRRFTSRSQEKFFVRDGRFKTDKTSFRTDFLRIAEIGEKVKAEVGHCHAKAACEH